eukprot:gnl/TRDRNA2_/TRDRNA2_116313_c0_seq1.p1 gnl/TRDRNA2_/TRDRNA2_116313_c0~~gnl/TRDRNA2_/TRDRNA2_116313_c0_seq1.p1  ORF type:complete len:177 (-),score=15.11 gnl/TRDRNA2_/TRDRNA2_116313_c0_seq1:43-573(-)
MFREKYKSSRTLLELLGRQLGCSSYRLFYGTSSKFGNHEPSSSTTVFTDRRCYMECECSAGWICSESLSASALHMECECSGWICSESLSASALHMECECSGWICSESLSASALTKLLELPFTCTSDFFWHQAAVWLKQASNNQGAGAPLPSCRRCRYRAHPGGRLPNYQQHLAAPQ